MTPLDVALHDAAEARDGPTCWCPTCGATFILLLAVLKRRGFSSDELRRRVVVRPFDCGSAAYPYVASVRVDGREVYRIHNRPDEVFEMDVLNDLETALRRPM